MSALFSVSTVLLAAAEGAEHAGSVVDASPGLAVWTTVTFLLVAAVLRWKVWGPLAQTIEAREHSIKAAIDQAKTEREQAEKLLAEQQKAIQEARREAGEMVRKSQAEVEKAKEQLFAQARKEADALLVQARQTISDEKQKALSEIRDVAVDLAIQAASKLLTQKLDDSAHRALAEEYVKNVQKGAAA
jgi:F-type H+-transporting ATPase subunit b